MNQTQQGQKLAQIRTYLDELMERSTPSQPVWNQEAVLENKPPQWSYIDGCMLMAVQKLYELTEEQAYFSFLENFIDFYINEEGEILGYDYEAMNSDSINEGKVLFFLYQHTNKEKYRKALDRLYQQVRHQPKTPAGSFWHKAIYPNQVWLDGLYMVQPFYTAYELVWNEGQQLPEIMLQFANVQKHMKDDKTGLLYHAFDESKKAFWANSETGCSASFWSRSLGWYAMALVDTIELLPQDSPEKAVLTEYLVELVAALVPYQEATTGLFYQVTDQGSRAGNYLETSGSCAIAYTFLKGARLNLLPTEFTQRGQRLLENIVAEKLTHDNDQWRLKDICLVAGVGGMNGKGDYEKRDGTYAYYISEPKVDNDAKGIGPLVYAYCEYVKSQN